ncbi:hypothetical protein [Bacillus sp. FJAT-49736]|nr:hypothetical protein [Bacillus sp. FJAT-49736]
MMNMKKPMVKAPVYYPSYAKPMMNIPNGKMVKKKNCGCGNKKRK